MFEWFPHLVNQLTLYDLSSGWVPCFALVGGVTAAFRRWNCNEKGCLRHGYPHGTHGRPVCNRHYHTHDPRLGSKPSRRRRPRPRFGAGWQKPVAPPGPGTRPGGLPPRVD